MEKSQQKKGTRNYQSKKINNVEKRNRQKRQRITKKEKRKVKMEKI